MLEIQPVVERILEARSSIPAQRALLAAISGIDGCGKGYLTARVVAALEARGASVAAINIDGWLNLRDRRFDPSNFAEHFYLHAIRFDEMFDQLVIPLRDRRSVRVATRFTRETASQYERRVYEFNAIDVVVLEGIFLLKRAFRTHYDLSVWIDCSFDTALERAIARAQEGLSPQETLTAYRSIYFPAQEIHYRRDDPRAAATLVVDNDSPPRGSG